MIAELGLTPLTGTDLVRGKYIAVWRLLRPLLAGALVGRFIFAIVALGGAWPWLLPRAGWDTHLLFIVAGIVETLLSLGCMTVFALHTTATRANITFASLAGMFLIGMFWLLATMLASVAASLFGPINRDFVLQTPIYAVTKYTVLVTLAAMLRISTARVYQEELQLRR